MSRSHSPLRIIIVTPFGPGGRGGMDRLSDAIIEGVRQTTSDVEVVALATYGKGSQALMPFHFLRALLELARVRVTKQADLLHINVAGGGSAYRKALLALWARTLGIPYIVHLHGSRFRETWPTSTPLLGGMLNAMFTNSRRTLVLGKVWSDYVASVLPGMSDKIIILPNATRSRSPRPPSDQESGPVHIVFMGLLGERKGSLLLIDALSRINPALAWKATIAGNGDIAAHQQAAERAGVAAKVRLPGWLGPADVDELLRAADVLTLPSFAENLPMVIVEAFAQGVPVVATPVGAVPEIVEDGVSGLLSPVGDAAALAAALEKLIASPELRHKMGATAREMHAERFELSGYIARLIDIWRISSR